MMQKKLSKGWIFFTVLLVIWIAQSCGESNQKVQFAFELLSPEFTGLDFVNELGVSKELNIFNYMYYYNGAGVAVGDFNNDGLTDIFFTSNLGEERMYLNRGGMKFEDVSHLTEISGGPNAFTTGVSVVDINGDGLLDIYVCQVGSYRNLDSRNRLFICTHINEAGIPQYREAAEEYGIDFKGFSTMAGFFDYDLDGDLDLFLMNHSLHHNGTFGQRSSFLGIVDSLSGDKLYRNDNGKFVDVTTEAGIHSMVIGYGLGLSFADVNMDGYPDIYVGNDFHENDYLYINNGDGTFTERIADYIGHTSKFSMGVDMADVNNDMLPDIISLDMLPEDPFILKSSEGEDALDIFNFKIKYGYNHQHSKNCLQINNGNGTFSEIGRYAGVYATDWSWTPLLFDFNLDGFKDLFITNGIPRRMNDIDYINFISGNEIQYKIQFDHLEEKDLSVIDNIPEIKLLNKFFLGHSDLRFEDIQNRIKGDKISFSNSAAYADFDNDGDLDVVVNNINDPAFLYRNKAVENGAKSCRIKLKGKSKNLHALGTKVIAWQKGDIQSYEQWQCRGFQSSMLTDIYISLTSPAIDSLLVIWPDNTFLILKNIDATEIDLAWEDGLPVFDYQSLKKRFKFSVSSHEEEFALLHTHKENPFVEFDREKLIPHSTSSEGPALAVGDLNGDGIDDIFMGSSKHHKAALYLSENSGNYRKMDIDMDDTYEETVAVIADLTGNGINDLMIGSGGNEFFLTSKFTAPLLYINDGTGNLTKKADAFPEKIRLTTGALCLIDINEDGLPDVFLGARAVPWAYGEIPTSYFLINKGNGIFEDHTERVLPDEGRIGMVMSCACADITGDNIKEIIPALEWGKAGYLKLTKDRFVWQDIFPENGWWTAVKLADLNGNGLQDIILTNQGLNTRLQAGKHKPVRMYYADFDDNDTKEQILSYYLGDQNIPFANISEFHAQIPMLKKRFIKAADFASSDFKKWFPAEKYAYFLEASYMKTSVFINQGDGKFSMISLPEETQWHYLSAIHIEDFDGDGYPEILLMGNYFDANVQLGRYDSCYGLILKRNKEGSYHTELLGGAVFGGQVKHILPIKTSGGNYLGVARNNDAFKLIQIQSL
jgi:enediyne biosynthesis protein E4